MIDSKVIEHLESLKKGWDTYGGEEIAQPAIDALKRVLVVPMGHGSVQLEMVGSDGATLIIEIGINGTIAGIDFDSGLA